LSFCPLHFAQWRHGSIKTDNVFDQILSQTQKTKKEGAVTDLQLLINLCGTDCSINFKEKHMVDLQSLIDLTNYFMDIIKEANELAIYLYEKIKDILLTCGKPASDDLFEEKLKGDLYEENIGATRYILSSIELAQSETKEIYVNFYARNKKLFVWTVEHIFPQGENIPQHWVDMVADGDRERANLIRKQYVHELGNLTLTGYNSQLSNMSLDKKQNRKSKDGKFIGFKNGLTLNDGIKDIGIWGKENIKVRTGQLVTKALEIFEL